MLQLVRKSIPKLLSLYIENSYIDRRKTVKIICLFTLNKLLKFKKKNVKI